MIPSAGSEATDCALAVYNRDGSTNVCYGGTEKGLGVCWLASDGVLYANPTLYLQDIHIKGLSISDDDRLLCCAGEQVVIYGLDSDATQPSLQTSTTPVNGTPEAGVLFGGRLYLAAGGNWFSIYAVNASGTCTHLQSIQTSGFASDVVLRTSGTDTLAYVAVGSAGVAAYRVHVTRPPELVCSWTGASVEDLHLHGQELYALSYPAQISDNGSVRVLSVADPSQIVALSSPIVVHAPKGMGVSGNYLYVTDGQVVKAYNVANPAAPSLLGFMDCREPGVAMAVAASRLL